MISFLGQAIRLKHHPENVPIMTSRRPGEWTTDRYARTALASHVGLPSRWVLCGAALWLYIPVRAQKIIQPYLFT